MVMPTENDRRKIVRQLALDLVEHIGVTQPPVWVENLLTDPPEEYKDEFCLVESFSGMLDAIYVPASEGRGRILVPIDMPLVERRFAVARELFNALVSSAHGHTRGFSNLLMPSLWESANYFARVLLAPDILVDAYRKQGRDLRGFAETFLIPPRIAALRWEDAIFPGEGGTRPLGQRPGVKSKATIQVVDDEIPYSRALADLLESNGFSVQVANNAEEALVMLDATPPDLILLDVMMPGTSGLTLLHQLRSDPSRSGIPVVLTSAKMMSEDRSAALWIGADGFLPKPFTSDELKATIQPFLVARNGRAYDPPAA